MESPKVIDNFLPKEKFSKLKNYIMGEYFPWYYNNFTLHPEDKLGLYQFGYTFYSHQDGENHNIPDFFVDFFVEEFFSRLSIKNIKELVRIKANLNPKTVENINTGFHIDYPNITTSVFYLNTNNGGTRFKDWGFVKSVSNRMVIFDSNSSHSGVTCTDENRRVVINFNYTK